MKFYRNIYVLLTLFGLLGCNEEYLQLEPTDKVSADALFSSPEGVKTFMAGLYYQMPIEDFNSTPTDISWNSADANNNGHYPIVITDDAAGSQRDDIDVGGNSFPWWNKGYKLNRDINLLYSVIPTLNVSQEEKDALMGEAAFMRAFTYFALAKRYGGVPIITEIADVEDEEAMFVPRSTEKETWDFALATCDTAIALLGDGDGNKRRGTKWAAYALKSRAALHAASLAKYWDRAPLSGDAKDAGMIGLDPSLAAGYYLQCIEASEAVISSGKFSLYKAAPGSAEEAAENYREMFEDPNLALADEVIMLKGFTLEGVDLGSNQDNWGNPAQTAGAWPHPGRFNPTIDFVDNYENYSNPGVSAPIVTTVDGDMSNYDGYDPARTYLEFDSPLDIFAGKDARLAATVILPSSIWKGVEIIIQGGYIQPDGTPVIEASGEIEVDGTIYYTYGASTAKLYSGFDPAGGNYTLSGFLFRKFLDQDYVPKLGWNFSTTDWIEFRYGEVLINYAEAVVESGAGDAALAATVMNDLRHRAAHTTDIPLTLENVLRERRVELAFENKRYWDLIRRREYHTVFFQSYRNALVPILDLRTNKYIFVRKHISNKNPHTFLERSYYKAIPGVESNGLTQNPQY